MEKLAAYLPSDRLRALTTGEELPAFSTGAALFADISGFTPLTEALMLSLGPQRGAEELPTRLNLVYDALIGEVHRWGGSVLGFAGDAITCWFGDTPLAETGPDLRAASGAVRAAAFGLALQDTMQQFANVTIPGAGTIPLAVKVGIASGPVRRFVVGDPDVQRSDVLAGATLDHMAVAEHQAQKGDVIVDVTTATALGDTAQIDKWREDHHDSTRFGGLRALTTVVTPPASPVAAAAGDALVRPWLHRPVYERLASGSGEFLIELRPAVALFMRFGGIDFDSDPLAPDNLDAFIEWVQTIFWRYDAHLIQLTIGDKGSFLYNSFGAPTVHENDAARACLAALELGEPRFSYLDAMQSGISQGQVRAGAYAQTTAEPMARWATK